MLLAGADSKHTAIPVHALLVSLSGSLTVFRKEIPERAGFIINLMVRAHIHQLMKRFGI